MYKQVQVDFRHLGGRFRRVQHLSTTDGYLACSKAARALAKESPQDGHASFTCDAHKVSHIAQKVDKAMRADIIVLINLALALQPSGGMAAFRRVLRKHVLASVVRLVASPGPAADAHRRGVLDLYCPNASGQPGMQMKRAVVEALANGDYASTREV